MSLHHTLAQTHGCPADEDEGDPGQQGDVDSEPEDDAHADAADHEVLEGAAQRVGHGRPVSRYHPAREVTLLSPLAVVIRCRGTGQQLGRPSRQSTVHPHAEHQEERELHQTQEQSAQGLNMVELRRRPIPVLRVRRAAEAMSRGMDVSFRLDRLRAWSGASRTAGEAYGDRRTSQCPRGHQVLRGAVDLSEHGCGAILVGLQEGDA